MATTSTIDLSQLPAPTVVQQVSFDAIKAMAIAKLQEDLPSFDATIESDPAVKVLEVISYLVMLLRQEFNERAVSMLLAFATGSDLDQLGALVDVARLSGELDDAYKARIQLAPTSFSVAGPEAAYRFFALSAASTIADVSVTTPQPDDIKALVDATLAAQGVSDAIRGVVKVALDAATWPGTVLLSLLSSQGDGTATAEEIATVQAAVADNAQVRPLTDHVVVQSAQIVNYSIVAELTLLDGPSSDVVLAASQAGAATFVTTARKIGRDINQANVFAKIAVDGVANVKLPSLPADMVIGDTQAGYCTGINITVAGRGE